jgi:MFS transporter, DHA2 family, methylenomycin A resistance protein
MERHDRRLVLLVMCAGYFLVLLDVTIVNVALPSIRSALDASVATLSWVVDAYALALASLMLTAGTFGDLHGHRRIVLAGFALFGAASLGCGLAPAAGVLVAFRALQGVGAALMLPGTLAVIADAFPGNEDRARALGIWAAVGSAALPAGPLLGGALVELVGWRAVFLLNVPVVALAIAAVARTVGDGRRRADRRLDVPGAILAASALAAATLAIVQAGHDAVVAAVAGVAAVLLAAAFIAVERARPDPMLPLGLLRRPAFSAANGVAGTMNLASLGLLFVLTLYLQDVRGDSALAAGLALLPLFAPLSLLAPFGGRLAARAGPWLPMTAGLLTAGAGVALLATIGRHAPYLELIPALLLWGAGLGVLTPAVVAAAVGAVDRSRAGLASAVSNTSRQAGGAVGIAGFGAVAGSPSSSGFLAGLHTAAIGAAGLFLLAAVATVALLRPS